MKKRINLAITSGVEKFAKIHGAYFDKTENAWVIDNDVPPELDEFVIRPIRTRQFHVEVPPQCAICGSSMLLKSSRQGGEFWSCSGFPAFCKGRTPYDTDTFVQVSTLDAPCNSPEAAKKDTRKETISVDVRAHVEKITTRAEKLFGHPGAAMRWLTLPKITLNHETPIKTMRDLAGCAKVEQLLYDCFK